MKQKTICTLLAVLLSAFPSQSQSAEPEGDFIVMTWNLEWFFDNESIDNRSDLAKEKSAPDRASWDWRRDAVAASLASVAPSLIAVQEVESGKVMGYLCSSLKYDHKLKYRVSCMDGAEPFTEQDVALLRSDDVWLRRTAHNGQSKKMYGSGDYYNVFKHIEAEYEIGKPSDPEVIIVINVHLRARAEKEDVRIRQARLVHHWVADRIAAGKNVIVLGDINTEEPGHSPRDDSDLGILCGKHTPVTTDDLIDLHSWLDSAEHRTHLLEGRAFDRILVSSSLIEDDPNRTDLVLRSVERRKDLAVKGDGIDDQEQHWDAYWEMDEDQRDLSDHWPVVARFQMK